MKIIANENYIKYQKICISLSWLFFGFYISFLVSRHNIIVNAIIDGIKSKRIPLPLGRRNNNLLADGKIPDVEF